MHIALPISSLREERERLRARMAEEGQRDEEGEGGKEGGEEGGRGRERESARERVGKAPTPFTLYPTF